MAEPTTTTTTTLGKSGIWTEHQDAHGRTFYFNMVAGRSFWTIPDELQAHVLRPAADAALAWGPDIRASDAQATLSGDKSRSRREQTMIRGDASTAGSTAAESTAATMPAAAAFAPASVAPAMAALHERMASAAQRKTQSELKRRADEKQRSAEAAAATASSQDASAYLAMVRQLQDVDKQSDSTGNKWLVR